MEWLFVVIHKIAIQIRAFHKECFSLGYAMQSVFGKMLLNSYRTNDSAKRVHKYMQAVSLLFVTVTFTVVAFCERLFFEVKILLSHLTLKFLFN